MCVAAFGEVVGLNGKNAVVSFRGALKEVSAVLVPNVSLGDSVVVHAGFATEIVKDTKKLYRDVVATDAYAIHLLDAIKKENEKLHGRQFKIMGFCGTHENTIVKYGLRGLLPPNISLISGPGCPVCVTPEEEVIMGIEAVKSRDVIMTTYGDLLRVPTSFGTLEQCRAEGCDIRMIYDISQALKIASGSKKEVVHFAVGFETTAPGTAALLKEAGKVENFSILSSHRITPPAMEHVLENSDIDAILCPGHVAMVIGTKPFDVLCKKYGVACVVSGFEPTDVLQAILMLLYEHGEEKQAVINQYSRVVEDRGNTLAQSLIDEMFTLKDANWRGVGVLPESRLVLKREYRRFDAETKLGLELKNKPAAYHGACICGEILKGGKPELCPSFGKTCTPADPKGPCMVSMEGTCYISYTNN